MTSVQRHKKKKNRYTSKQKKCKNIRREKYSSTPGTTLNPSQFKLTQVSISCKLSCNM